MSFCPECGEENPEGSKFCRKCGITLIHETPEVEPKQTTAKKVTVETNQGPINTQTVNTNSSTINTSKKDDNAWCLCCICVIFLFIIFAALGL